MMEADVKCSSALKADCFHHISYMLQNSYPREKFHFIPTAWFF